MGHKVSTMQSSIPYILAFILVLSIDGIREAVAFTCSYPLRPNNILGTNKLRNNPCGKLTTHTFKTSSKLSPFPKLVVSAPTLSEVVETDYFTYANHKQSYQSRQIIKASMLSRCESSIEIDKRRARHRNQRRRALTRIRRRRRRIAQTISIAQDSKTSMPDQMREHNSKKIYNSEEDLRDWACATDVSTLRLMFGTNRNKIWGDLNAFSARKLYHALLPRTLIALRQQGLTPSQLAPLAFEARCAAKQYVRERSHVPGRIFSMAFDGFRHLKKYGNWRSNGMTWEEIWEKYEGEIKEELRGVLGEEALFEVDLTSCVCSRILERSCVTNSAVDALALESDGGLLSSAASHRRDEKIIELATKYQNEVNDILNRVGGGYKQQGSFTPSEFFALKVLMSTKRQILILAEWKKAQRRKLRQGCRSVKSFFSEKKRKLQKRTRMSQSLAYENYISTKVFTSGIEYH